jgi:tRNA(Ile)-lysidine synthase
MVDATLEQALRRWSGEPLLLGLSGGLDSTVLLHALAGRPAVRAAGLRAVHVDHGLHDDAGQWAAHCQRFCAGLAVGLSTVRVDIARDRGQGLEAAARDARYGAFAELLGPGESLVLAHHREDQAETVLLRLLRASGSDGLAAMQSRRPFAGGVLWRPLLELPRTLLLEYAQTHALDWIEDPSNAEHGLDRNFLRHRVLPVLAERWPQAARALARSASLLAEDVELLQAGAQERLQQVRATEADCLSVSALLALPRPWRARVLRLWLSGLGLPPLPGPALAVIESELLPARADARAQYRWAGAVLWRWRDLLHAQGERPALALDWTCEWNGVQALALPDGDQLAFRPGGAGAPPMPERFVLTARRGGERITLPQRAHSHALRQCLQQAGVPPWQRERLPLLWSDDGELLAAGDRIISARLQRWCSTHDLQLDWRRAAGVGSGN